MIERICWLLLAAIHVTPALAFVRPALIVRLYGVAADAPAFLLLRHRAALFLVIVAVAVWAAFDPASRRVATVALAISMGSFVLLYATSGAPVPLRTIAIADAVGLVVLLYVGWSAFA